MIFKVYAARNKNGELYFYTAKPKRFKEDNLEYWVTNGFKFKLPKAGSQFIDLNWDKEPLEVKLTIER